MQVNEKHQVSIYKIESSNLEQVSNWLTEKGYVEQMTSCEVTNGFVVKIFYITYSSTPKWKRFIRSIADCNAQICGDRQSLQEGYVLLLCKSNRIHAVTAGPGYFAIQDLIDENFGIDVFSRIAKKDDRVIRSAREKSLVGGILGTTKHFRTTYNLQADDGFGKIYQEFKASVDNQILIEELGFTEEELRRESLIIAKSSFTVRKSISFHQLLNMVDGLESLLSREVSLVINSAKKLSKKKDQDLMRDLESQLIDQLWQRYSRSGDSYSFDLCHREFDKYITASSYVIRKGASRRNFFGEYEFDELRDIDILFRKILDTDGAPSDKDEFSSLIQSLKIFALDSDGNIQTMGDLFRHLLGDVEHNGQKYFFIDNCWYHIDPIFINRMNESCARIISACYHTKDLKVWDSQSFSEGDYNASYLGDENTLVLDRVTPENIELCDFMRWSDDTLYLYHVKASFGNTMRDLCSQIFIAASRLIHDLESDKSYIRLVYNSIQRKIGGEGYFDQIGRQTERITIQEFEALFSKRVVFVLAVLDVSELGDRNIKCVSDFNSNIAKFSIQELHGRMRGIDIPLEIIQIFRPSI